ncbi:hypothetical protein BKA80DRAFT_279128 [Phyllosticta citrichinensis]
MVRQAHSNWPIASALQLHCQSSALLSSGSPALLLQSHPPKPTTGRQTQDIPCATRHGHISRQPEGSFVVQNFRPWPHQVPFLTVAFLTCDPPRTTPSPSTTGNATTLIQEAEHVSQPTAYEPSSQLNPCLAQRNLHLRLLSKSADPHLSSCHACAATIVPAAAFRFHCRAWSCGQGLFGGMRERQIGYDMKKGRREK